MRIVYALPLAALFGCAHQNHAEDQSAMNSPPPQSQPQTQTPTPTPVAGAEPTSSPDTCGLVHLRFDTDSSDLDEGDKALLGEEAACLKQNKQLRVSVEGNTDERGPEGYNRGLGEARASAVTHYLEGQGVSPNQLRQISFGKDNPLCNQPTQDCWAKNRRTAIRPTCHM